jgi:signal transduction histidine kinase
VSFGFFLVDRELRITDGYTRSLGNLLGRDRIAGEAVAACLGFTGGAADHFTMCVSQIFDDLLPEELSCDQVPSRVVRDGRTLRVQVSAVRDGTGEVRQLLFGISDVTDLEAAERSNRESQMLLRALKNPDPFRRFVADLTQRFGSAREAVQGDDELRARRELHTIKGNASCYGLTELAGRVHALEEHDIIELPPVVDLEDEFSQFLQSHVDVLGIEPGKPEREVYRIDGDEVARMEAMLADADDLESLRRRLGARLDRLRWLAASRLLGPLDTQVTSLGQRLGKEVALRVQGGDVSVLPAGIMPIISVLPHLIRNAIDHGIEAPGGRGDKPARSMLEIAFDDDARSWRVSVTDDGRGIDVERLRVKAIERGVITAQEALTHEQLCALIFQPRLSTAEAVSDISGRGEGMAAVADAVKRIDGTIRVTSSAGAGTKIEIEVPKPRAQQAAAAA